MKRVQLAARVSLVGALAVALASATGPVRAQVPAQVPAQLPAPAAPGMTRADYEACQTGDEAAFRAAVQKVMTRALEKGLTGLDYKGLVGDVWRKESIDQVVATSVDAAVDAVRQESSWGRLIESIANPDTARELATIVAERVYRSDSMKAAIERLAAGVGREVGQRIETATAEAGDPAAQCMRAFLGPRYGTTIAAAVSGDTRREFAVDPGKATAEVTPGTVILEGRTAIAGAVLLIVRRQLATMASRIAQRLVGVVLGRIVSTVAGGIGLLLIAKDVWDFRHGVLPIIAEEMKSPSTREKVQVELAAAIGDQIKEHVQEIGSKAAERVVEIWHEFRRAHAKVLELADKDAAFRRFLDAVSPARLGRLDETVALVLAGEGEAAIIRRLGDGTLAEAVERLPAPAFEIARDLRSLDLGLKWAALAGPLLPKVIENELHRKDAPDAFSKAGLARLLGLDDRLAVARLASVGRSARAALLELPDADLKRLARAMGESELKGLAGYLGGLESGARKLLLQRVAEVPARMQAIAPDYVRAAILASRDQTAAVRLMLRGEGPVDVLDLLADARLAGDGRIDPRLIWARHPVAVSLAGGGGALLLMLLWRMLFGRRRRPPPASPGVAA